MKQLEFFNVKHFCELIVLKCFLQCQKQYQQGDLIVLNGTEEDIVKMKTNMEDRRMKAKLEKVTIKVTC